LSLFFWLCRATQGFKVCAYNRTTSKVDHFLENEAKGEFERCLAEETVHRRSNTC
jgi:6-phosphogluconate dehydrogenase